MPVRPFILRELEFPNGYNHENAIRPGNPGL